MHVPFCGVAPKSKLLIYKVTRRNSENGKDEGEALVDDIAMAIRRAVHKERADIISISMTAEKQTNLLHEAVHSALALNRIIIASAGNEGSLRVNGTGYPGRYSSIITVASHGRFGEQSAFSSFGGEVDMGAPGEKIWSTWMNSSYQCQTGTSMAAPYVAGIAALLLSDPKVKPKIRNNDDMRWRLVRRLTVHPGWYDPRYLGYGALAPSHYLGREQESGDDERKEGE